MARKFANNAFSLLAAGITDVAVSLTVTAGEGARYPSLTAGEYFMMALVDGINVEIVKVTARATDSMTIVRAQEGTTARAWSAGAVVSHRLTAEALAAWEAHVNATASAHAASAIANTPAGNIIATSVQAAINELDSEKQPINGTLTAIAAGTLGSLSHRNVVINGNMAVAQRSTSWTGSTPGFNALDRWGTSVDGSYSHTISQVFFAAGSELEEGVNAYMRVQQNSVSGQSWVGISTPIEGVRTLNGEQVTLSFWARNSFNHTLNVSSIQYFGPGGSATVNNGAGSYAVTTEFQKFSYTFTLPSISGKTLAAGNDLILYFALPTNVAFTFDIAGVQLERGLLTPFEARTYGDTLAACQRYYVNYYHNGSYCAETKNGSAIYRRHESFPVTMRAVPTVSVVGYAGGGTLVTEYATANGFTWGANTPSTAPFCTGYIANAELAI